MPSPLISNQNGRSLRGSNPKLVSRMWPVAGSIQSIVSVTAAPVRSASCLAAPRSPPTRSSVLLRFLATMSASAASLAPAAGTSAPTLGNFGPFGWMWRSKAQFFFRDAGVTTSPLDVDPHARRDRVLDDGVLHVGVGLDRREVGV